MKRPAVLVKQLNVRIPSTIIDMCVRAAAADDRTLSSWVRRVLARAATPAEPKPEASPNPNQK